MNKIACMNPGNFCKQDLYKPAPINFLCNFPFPFHLTLVQGRLSVLGRTNFQGLGGCYLVGVAMVPVICAYRPAAVCASVWCAHQCSVRIRSSCRTANSCNKQVSESSNTRLKPRLEGKQRLIDHHHHHGDKC